MNLEEIVKNAKKAVLVGQNTGSSGNTATANKTSASNNSQGAAAKAFNTIKAGTATTVKNPQTSIQYFGNGTTGVSALNGAGGSSTPKTGSGGGSGGGTSTVVPDYQSTLDDLYNKVMGYGSYTPTTYTAGVYTPSTYSRTVDTSGAEAALQAALADIQGYGDFSYDLNSDMLYQNALDNYMMLGQQAMADAMGQAAALTGGYGNSYAASVGNQAYQNYITQANNMIPQFQQMALDTWQSGFDRRLGVYDAASQQLANLLNLENTNFGIWSANESNAANAFSMNESNRYNAWAQNEQNAYNEWLAGYTQAQDQYELAKDYYATLEALQQSSGGSGSSSSGSKSSSTSKIPTVSTVYSPVETAVDAAKDWEEYYKNISKALK